MNSGDRAGLQPLTWLAWGSGRFSAFPRSPTTSPAIDREFDFLNRFVNRLESLIGLNLGFHFMKQIIELLKVARDPSHATLQFRGFAGDHVGLNRHLGSGLILPNSNDRHGIASGRKVAMRLFGEWPIGRNVVMDR